MCVSDESCRKHVSSPDGFTMKIRPDGTYSHPPPQYHVGVPRKEAARTNEQPREYG